MVERLTVMLLLVSLGSIGCDADRAADVQRGGQSAGAYASWPPEQPEGGEFHFYYPDDVFKPTNELEFELTLASDTFHHPDSVVAFYRVRNPGPALRFLDFPENYFFQVVGPDGNPVERFGFSEQYGHHGRSAIFLERDQATPRHAINLACMPYHPLSFELLFPWSPGPYDEIGPCQLVYDLSRPGRYMVIGQHVPAAPEGREPDPQFMPSRADTAEFFMEPRGRTQSAREEPGRDANRYRR